MIPLQTNQTNQTTQASVHKSAVALLSLLLATGGLGVGVQSAIAQEVVSQSPTINYNSVTGSVNVDRNAFDIRTGELRNGSNILLPNELPKVSKDRVSIPARPGVQAPNSIETTADVDYINQSFNSILMEDMSNVTYTILPDSLALTTQFDVRYRRGDHAFGEGIQATVFGADGAVKDRQSAFVRGDRIRTGPNGESLPASNQLGVTYGANDKVELRVLNLRENNAQPTESAIYFSRDGQFIVEDLQDGGDRDFNDGDYLEISQGKGEALSVEETAEVSTEIREIETPLAPETRQDEIVETSFARSLQAVETSVEENKTWGRIESPDTLATRLGHASGLRTEAGEQLVYNRYSSEAEVRLGSDGLSATGQLAPIAKNPNMWPTLLSGSLAFDPSAGDNEAGFATTVGVTQFLNPTHRLATDVLGNVIENPEAQGPRLVEPAGLFTNRKWVGYVLPTPDETSLGDRLLSVNGIFNLPGDRAVTITPADAQTVGRGNSAYTDNVGGLLIESAAGDISFVPQWTKDGYAQDSIDLAAGAARRIVYALVPQQAGQNLRLGQTYAVASGPSGYQILEGGFTIISADRQPQNFFAETSEVYAVEDTLTGKNAETAVFNGQQGVYAETLGGERVPTVDVGLATEADARVGNRLFPTNVVVGDPGQSAYAKTTRAAGFYLGGSMTLGIGNQRDTVSRTVSTVARATDEVRSRRTLNTFSTPRSQIDVVELQTTTTTQTDGRALFDINREGKLENVRFVEGDRRIVETQTSQTNLEQRLVLGEEFLMSAETSESVERTNSRVVAADRQTTSESESYANFSAVQGELALGGVLNFGNTPWTAAANMLRAELFTRDDLFGRGSGGETGWRAEALFHPFGEQQRAAYQYDTASRVIALYQTEPVRDASGSQVVETLTKADGSTVAVPVNQFVLNEEGQRLAQTVGTGKAKGPGIYLRVED
ncbi:MAG: hypothetical protein WBA76_22235, partial [Phormidesmis sp.]